MVSRQQNELLKLNQLQQQEQQQLFQAQPSNSTQSLPYFVSSPAGMNKAIQARCLRLTQWDDLSIRSHCT